MVGQGLTRRRQGGEGEARFGMLETIRDFAESTWRTVAKRKREVSAPFQ